jgi:hypothetical protein
MDSIFCLVFYDRGTIAPFAFIAGLAGAKSSLSLFGLKTTNPLSVVGLFLIFTFMFFGIIALALWTERVWAVKLAKVGALYGIAFCIFMTFIYPFVDGHEGYYFSFRLELIVLVPYFNKLNHIQKEWEEDEFIPER